MAKFIRRRYLTKLLAMMYGLFFLFLSTTNPRSLPILLLILPVLWLFLCLTLTIFLCINLYAEKNKPIEKKDIVISMGGAGVFCIILLLRSVNQLNARDVLLVVTFLVIASFYVRKIRLPSKL